jgi:cytochrome P450
METATTKKSAPPYAGRRHWLFGHATMLRNDAIGRLHAFIRDNGNIFSLKVPFFKVVIASNPEHARHLLQDNSKNYHKSRAYDMLKPLLGLGLLTSEGSFWKKQRKLAQPAFHKRKLDEWTEMMVERAQHTLEHIRPYAIRGEALDMLPEMTALTLDIISKAIFSTGVEDKAKIVGEQITLMNEYTIDRLHKPFRLPNAFPTPANLKQKRSLALLDKIIYEIIDKRKAEGIAKDDLLSMLMDARDEETGETMSKVQLRDELMTIFIAGNETSSNALSWTFYLLSQNADAEQKMAEEIEGKFSSGIELNYKTVGEFHYVRQVIEESMRMYPPVWTIGRRAIADDEIDGYRIEKYTNVLIPIIYLHRTPRFWDQPGLFKPGRFAPELRNSIDRFVYFPFGGGPRFCIGNNFAMLEMQIILIIFYREYRFRLKEGFHVEADPLVTLRPKDGMMMYAEKRLSKML